MKSAVKDCLFADLKSEGFSLDFEAKADIGGGFECYIFSNEANVALITAESVHSRNGGDKTKMAYKHYCCQLGDDEFLEKFLELEGIIEHPNLMSGEYGELFSRLVDKVKSYGTRNADLLIMPSNSVSNPLYYKIHTHNNHENGSDPIDKLPGFQPF